MRSLSQAIARCEAHLRFIPVATVRQMRVVALLNEVARADFSYARLQDELGRMIGGAMWPLSPARLKKIPALGPVESALTLASDLYEQIWDGRAGAAFTLPDDVILRSPIYEFILRPLDQRHIAFCFCPQHGDSRELMIVATRGHERGEPFAPRDLEAVEKVCAHFAPVLATITPGWTYQPRQAVPAEHSTELDGNFRPAAMSLFMHAILALFYGESRQDQRGRALLPAALEAELRKGRTRSGEPQEGEIALAFTRRYRGRLLCLVAHWRADGSGRLSVYEDVSRHEHLLSIRRACQALGRDRLSVFSAALVIAEGVEDLAEIARRAGFGKLKPSSAQRIVNQARRILRGL